MQKYKDQLRTQKHKKLFFKLVIFLTAGIAVFAGLIYFLFFSGIFDVRSVSIEAPEGLRDSLSSTVDSWLSTGFWELTPAFWGLTRRNNIFFASTEKLAFRLAKQFPKLELINIDKDFPHGLLLSAVERKPAGIWCQAEQNQCFYFDDNGMAFSETQPSAGFLITSIVDYRVIKKIELGDEVIAKEWSDDIMKAKELFDKTDVNISEFTIPSGSFDEFHAKTTEGWKIMFSTQTDIEKQTNALAIFLKEKIKPDQRSDLQYVDLRIQDRIYYK